MGFSSQPSLPLLMFVFVIITIETKILGFEFNRKESSMLKPVIAESSVT
jgi:hypothetical protein